MSRFFKDAVSDSNSSESSSDSESLGSSEAELQRRRRAFQKGGSDDDETSSSDADSSDMSSDEEDDEASHKQTAKASGAARFMRGAADSEDSDSDEDVKRVVKSTRDKRFEDMRGIVKAGNNARKINDWVNVQNEFDKLTKAMVKAAAIISREKVPRFFVRSLVQLEDTLKATLENKDLIKKMNPSTAKAFNAMKQKIKKSSKQYEREVAAFRFNPMNEDESASEAERLAMAEEEDESEDEAPVKGKVSFQTAVDGTDDGFTVVGKGGKVVTGANSAAVAKENLFKRLVELLEERGKKSTDKLGLIDNIAKLMPIAVTPYQTLKVLLALIPARFDYVASTGFTPVDLWKNALTELNQLFDILEKHANASIGYLDEDDQEESEVLNEKKFDDNQPIRIQGHLGSFIDRLDDEFTKSLQNIDPHTSEYIERLRDEASLYSIIVRAQKYFETKKKSDNQDAVDSIKMRRVDHIYNKSDALIKAIEESVSSSSQASDPSSLVSSLCTSLYKTNNDRIRTRALLAHVYHLALHDQFAQARDMLLMSHLQEAISNTDIQTQVFFNRTMVQIGMAAFRAGLIRDACYALQEITSSGKVRELLAQGMQAQRFSDKTAEQEKQEKLRQYPFHTHINLELIECVYLVSAMLLEIPNMAQALNPDTKRKVISKSFRRMFDYNDRQSFSGPPENTKDYILAAAKAMAAGELEEARDFLMSIKIWDIMPQAEEIKTMLTLKVQEETLRTYVLSYARYYDSIALSDLSVRFSVPPETVLRLVSKMILHEHISGRLSNDNTLVILDASITDKEQRTIPELNSLADTYLDKVSAYVDMNEKILESKATLVNIQSGYRVNNNRNRNDRRGNKNYVGR